MSGLYETEFERRERQAAEAEIERSNRRRYFDKLLDESGSNAETVKNQYSRSITDDKMIDQLAAEHKHSKEQGDAFLKGFLNASSENGYQVSRN